MFMLSSLICFYLWFGYCICKFVFFRHFHSNFLSRHCLSFFFFFCSLYFFILCLLPLCFIANLHIDSPSCLSGNLNYSCESKEAKIHELSYLASLWCLLLLFVFQWEDWSFKGNNIFFWSSYWFSFMSLWKLSFSCDSKKAEIRELSYLASLWCLLLLFFFQWEDWRFKGNNICF